MKGIFITNPADVKTITYDRVKLELLYKMGDTEIMRYIIPLTSVVYVSPADTPDVIEHFYVLEGGLQLTVGGEVITIKKGGSFYATGLRGDVLLTPIADVVLLYYVNKPMFDYLYGYQQEQDAILRQIDIKDHHTAAHSNNVMRIGIEIYKHLIKEGKGDGFVLSMDDMVRACLFHDVGKCFVPDEILRQRDVFTPREREIMQSHPANGAKVLSKYGENVCKVVACHHERLDGSGYPNGLKGKEIPLESQIIAIADSYDSMTTPRTYKSLLLPNVARQQLKDQPSKYNAEYVELLSRLMEEGELDEYVVNGKKYLEKFNFDDN